MSKNHNTKAGAGEREREQRTTSEVEELARKLADCKKWKKVEEHHPRQSGWYPVVVRGHYDIERQWPAIGRYSWSRSRWLCFCAGELKVEGTSSVITHWLDTPLPSLPPTSMEGV